jgi:FkbM family methyltransferase
MIELLREALARRFDIDAANLPRIAIVGAASEGRRLTSIVGGTHIAAIVDDDPSRVGTYVFGERVEPFAALTALPHNTPIVIASHRVLDASRRARALGFTRVFPFALLQVLFPDIYTPHMFYEGILEDLLDNAHEYKWLSESLADSRSLDVLAMLRLFRLTWDARALEPIIEDSLYYPQGLFKLALNEVYVDAGAFDGDSIRAFIKRVDDRYERIIAFEPDPMTHVRLCEAFTDERIKLYNAALYSQCGEVSFCSEGTRGARIGADGRADVLAVALDGVLNGARVSFIKMNIEGAERFALEGARDTIKRWRPKLAISVYHRPSDLWQIARDIREIDPNYDLYLRQHDGGIIETVLYALPRA